MPNMYPVDAFMLYRDDNLSCTIGLEHGDMLCHACFDAIYPWTEHWSTDHPRVRDMIIAPARGARFHMLNTYNYETTQVERCACCDRILFNALCTKDDPFNGPCECEDCDPDPYVADTIAALNGTYSARRAGNSRATYNATLAASQVERQRDRVRFQRSSYEKYVVSGNPNYPPTLPGYARYPSSARPGEARSAAREARAASAPLQVEAAHGA